MKGTKQNSLTNIETANIASGKIIKQIVPNIQNTIIENIFKPIVLSDSHIDQATIPYPTTIDNKERKR